MLCVAEAAERFGFYTMKTPLVFFLTERLGMPPDQAANLVGSYIGAVYLAPLLGGRLADRYWGFLRTVLVGGFVMAVGHAVLIRETLGALYVAMGILALGNGLFKPNMQCLVRNLYYKRNDPLVDEAFSYYYFGVNLGAAAAVLVAELLRARWGWSAVFGAAAVGLLAGLVQLVLQIRYVRHAAHASSVGAILGVDIADPAYRDLPTPEERPEERRRIWAILGLTGIGAIFWTAFNQEGTTLPIWTRDGVERGGISPLWFSLINPLTVMIGTPLVIWLGRHLRLSTTTKVLAGMVLAAMAFGIFGAGALHPRAHWGWVLGGYVVLTFGELFVSPGGNALIGKLAPARHVGILTAVWLLGSALGGKAAGLFGLLWGQVAPSRFFWLVGLAALLTALAVLLTRRPLQGIIDLAEQPPEPRSDPARVVAVTVS